MAKQYRVGVIGTGGIARVHLGGWGRLTEARVVAAADINGARLKDFAAEFGIPKTYEDYGEMLKSEELDIVDICAPNSVHCPAALAAFKQGRHVYCEKPMALNAGQVRRMIAASEAAGRKLMAGQQQRFTTQARLVKEKIERGELGEIYYVRAQALRRRYLPARPGFIKKSLSGGGPLVDIGVHILDLTLWLMGFPAVASVSGVAQKRLAGREDIRGEWGEWDRKAYDVEDFAVGQVRFKNGGVLTLECSFLLNMKEREIFGASLFGTEAGVTFPPVEMYREEKGEHLSIQQIPFPDRSGPPHYQAIAAFLEAVKKDRPVPVRPAESLAVMEILDAIYQSSKTGREVRFK
ncbi:MAG TPA: Gfo/Idh/MocA family oxidoreductase [bacterium]|nr:Gfo/Idh/MocA family oxidoreductase [bacterium]HNS49479.1 Gfo/Idh/MocA family oxidoreductase [bacterium]